MFPSKAIGLKTLMEMWIGQKTDYNNLRSFGCATYSHIREDKLGRRALNCVFLRYPDGVKGYKLGCLEDGKQGLVISRNVTFNKKLFSISF